MNIYLHLEKGAMLVVLSLFALPLLATTNEIDEKGVINTASFEKAQLKPVTDKAKPESKKSIAQEQAISKENPQTNLSDAKPKQEADLIDGLILNRAMTRFGHRFYREFVAAYRDINGTGEHSGLTVVEQATARSGSKILVLHNRKPVFVTFVSPASRNIDAQADMAAERVNNSILQYQKQAKWSLLSEPDLAPDEF